MNEAVRTDIEKAIFGKQVEDFLSSDIGKYLQQRVEDERHLAICGLRDCDPTNFGKVMEYQSQLKRAENFFNWLGSAIQEGLQSLDLLEDADLNGGN